MGSKPGACHLSWILCVAVGLTGWLVNAQIPAQLLEWTRSHVESRAMFLIGLNLFLLAVGSVMDISRPPSSSSR